MKLYMYVCCVCVCVLLADGAERRPSVTDETDSAAVKCRARELDSQVTSHSIETAAATFQRTNRTRSVSHEC